MFVNFNMHRILLSILLTTSLFAKDVIAVIALEQKGLTKQDAEILTDRLTTKLISIGKYEVVERTNMDKILKEQKFQQSGCTDSECAVEIGQLLNTDFIVIGSVSKFGSTYAVDARLIDVAQGKSLISAEFSMEGKIDALLTTGITSVAKQLCGMQASTTLEKPAQSSISYTTPSLFGNLKQELDLSDKTWSVGVGIFSPTPNMLEITKDFKITKGTSIYLSAGYPFILVGISSQSNYNNNGLLLSASIGDGRIDPVASYIAANIAYQWRFNRLFLSIGIGILELNPKHDGSPLMPIASLDYRF